MRKALKHLNKNNSAIQRLIQWPNVKLLDSNTKSVTGPSVYHVPLTIMVSYYVARRPMGTIRHQGTSLTATSTTPKPMPMLLMNFCCDTNVKIVKTQLCYCTITLNGVNWKLVAVETHWGPSVPSFHMSPWRVRRCFTVVFPIKINGWIKVYWRVRSTVHCIGYLGGY